MFEHRYKFINKALNILGMKKLTDTFYNVWATKAQFESGIFEQRYYSTGELAPSWGVQIDETAAILIGVYENGKWRKLEDLIYKAAIGLLNFINEEHISKTCFDLWEERKGNHLYSTSSIYEGLKCANEMLLSINKIKYRKLSVIILKELKDLKEAIKNKFVKDNRLIRTINDKQIDISLLSAVVPYKIFDVNDEVVKNTVELIEQKLKLNNGGYLRYEWDNYMGGNAWIISTLWLSLYYIELKNYDKGAELFNWVTDHADNLNFLPEQIEREGHKSAWVMQLSWSHAMYVIVKDKLMRK